MKDPGEVIIGGIQAGNYMFFCVAAGVSSLSKNGNSDSSGGGQPVPRFEIIAAVVEGGLPGTWIRERGTLLTAVDGVGEFDFQVAGVDGKLLIGKVYPETRILLVDDVDGITEITAADLQANDKAIVEAVFIPGDATGPTPKSGAPDVLGGTLRIAIMLVTMGDGGGVPPTPTPPVGIVSGKLQSVDSKLGVLIVTTATGDRCVTADQNTVVLQITITADGVDAMKATLDELIIGGRILASGTDDACLTASIIVGEGPDVSIPGPVTP
jgi:hypothetical protein